MCLKCSTNQASLGPQGQEGNQSSATLSAPPSPRLFLPPCSVLRYLSLPRSLTTAPSIPPFFFPSPERKNKQLSGSWILNEFEGQRGRTTFSRGARWRRLQHMRTWVKTSVQTASNKYEALHECPPSSKPERSCCLNQYCSLSQPLPSRWLVYVCVHNGRTCLTMRLSKQSCVRGQVDHYLTARFSSHKSPLKFRQPREVDFTSVSAPQRAAGSGWINGSLFILSIITTVSDIAQSCLFESTLHHCLEQFIHHG